MFHFGFRSPPSAGSESTGRWEKLAVLSSACFVSYNFASLSLCSSPKPLSASSIAGILPKEILSTGERRGFFPFSSPVHPFVLASQCGRRQERGLATLPGAGPAQ